MHRHRAVDSSRRYGVLQVQREQVVADISSRPLSSQHSDARPVSASDGTVQPAAHLGGRGWFLIDPLHTQRPVLSRRPGLLIQRYCHEIEVGSE